jgi:hypothetical protein
MIANWLRAVVSLMQSFSATSSSVSPDARSWASRASAAVETEHRADPRLARRRQIQNLPHVEQRARPDGARHARPTLAFAAQLASRMKARPGRAGRSQPRVVMPCPDVMAVSGFARVDQLLRLHARLPRPVDCCSWSQRGRHDGEQRLRSGRCSGKMPGAPNEACDRYRAAPCRSPVANAHAACVFSSRHVI